MIYSNLTHTEILEFIVTIPQML